MDLKTTKNQEIFSEIKKIGNVVFYFALFFSFFAVAGYYMMNVNIDEKSVPDYANLTNKSYKEYEKMMNGKNVEGLIVDSRFIEMEYDENLNNLIKGSFPRESKQDIFK